MTDKKTKKQKTKKQNKKTSLDNLKMEDDKQIVIINNIQPPAQEPLELRTISLYGDITEQKGSTNKHVHFNPRWSGIRYVFNFGCDGIG